MSLFCFFPPQNSFPRPSGSNPGFFPFPGGLRWIDRDLRLRTTGVPPLNREKSLQSSASTSVCRPRYLGQTQGYHLSAGLGRLGGILIIQKSFWCFGLLNFFWYFCKMRRRRLFVWKDERTLIQRMLVVSTNSLPFEEGMSTKVRRGRFVYDVRRWRYVDDASETNADG